METAIILLEKFREHDTGFTHPESPARITAIIDRIANTPLLDSLLQVDCRPADTQAICRIHSIEYVSTLEKLCLNGSGYFDPDTPYCDKTYAIASLAAGAGLRLADLILEKTVRNGMAIVRPPGHHAEKNHAMGFCFFNNVAITAKYLQSRGMERVFIVDWDVHHGNGTQHSFYNDDSVFFSSLHQYPYYPGTGSANETGTGPGAGYTLNLPVPAGTGGREYLNIFKENILPAIRNFHPDIILVSAGFDAHKNDPLGGLNLETDTFRTLTELVMAEADDLCDGRLISFLEGGYHLPSLAESTAAHLAALAGI